VSGAKQAMRRSLLTRIRLLIVAILLCVLHPAAAQDSIRVDSSASQVSSPAPVIPPKADTAKQVTADTAKTEHPSELLIPEIEKSLSRYPLYFLYIFGGCFVLLALIRLLTPAYLGQLFLSLFNLKILLGLYKEGRFDWNLNNLLIDIIAVLMFGTLIHQGFFHDQNELYVWVIAFTAMAYFLKMIAVVFLANIFLGRGEALVHLLLHTMFVRITGLALLPLLLAGLYQGFIPVPQLLTYFGYGIGFLYLILLVRLYVKMKSVTTGGAFYLFLYLCTIEISPLLVCLKTVIL
jgi:hypothetical protein